MRIIDVIIRLGADSPVLHFSERRRQWRLSFLLCSCKRLYMLIISVGCLANYHFWQLPHHLEAHAKAAAGSSLGVAQLHYISIYCPEIQLLWRRRWRVGTNSFYWTGCCPVAGNWNGWNGLQAGQAAKNQTVMYTSSQRPVSTTILEIKMFPVDRWNHVPGQQDAGLRRTRGGDRIFPSPRHGAHSQSWMFLKVKPATINAHLIVFRGFYILGGVKWKLLKAVAPPSLLTTLSQTLGAKKNFSNFLPGKSKSSVPTRTSAHETRGGTCKYM